MALKDGRFTWRHDSVLKIIARLGIYYYHQEEEDKGMTLECLGNLARSCNSNRLKVYDCRHSVTHVFLCKNSINIAKTRYCALTRQTVLFELTVPWEEMMDEAHERKMVKYQQLVEDCH